MSKAMVDSWGGELYLESTSSSGSSFVFTISISTRDESFISTNQMEIDGLYPTRKQVLIVDDDEFNLFSVEKLIH